MKTVGLIVNPIAGMGGRVALKGTDGAAVLAEAIRRGAVPQAHLKAEQALRCLRPWREQLTLLTCSGPMGAQACATVGLDCQVVYTCAQPTSEADTLTAARVMLALQPDLLLFCGGDGTVRAVTAVIGQELPALGVPAGVKIQSAVFAVDATAAGTVAAGLFGPQPLRYAEREVVDLDEDAYRAQRVSAALYGYLRVPVAPRYVQSAKVGFSGRSDLSGAGQYLADQLEAGCVYAVGSGSQAKCLSRELGLDYELLGVDLLADGRLLARDVTEQQLWQTVQQRPLRIIVSPIGGQGFIFGRGNPQFSPRVLAAVGRQRVAVVASQDKLLSIASRVLRVDSGDPAVDESLRGYYTVLCGYGQFFSLRCE